ncbi:MAG: isochorismate synthase [Variovorax sp.]|nr:MAG: isochorismate synthase [Variovorax sp.]
MSFELNTRHSGDDRATGPDGDFSTDHADTLDALLAAYQPGDSLFASPSGAWLGQGVACTLRAGDGTAWPASVEGRAQAAADVGRRARALLAQAEQTPGLHDPIVMGVVPFDVRQPARLVVPRQVRRAVGGQRIEATAPGSAWAPVVLARPAQPAPEPAAYEAAVTNALARFARGDLDKVVLARTLRLTLQAAPDRAALLRRLVAGNTHGYTYAIALTDAAGAAAEGLAEPAAFVGATPELLVRRTGRQVVVNPLAGSAARSADPVRDPQIGQALMQSPKDRHEHAVVIDSVARALRPLCRTLTVPEAPSLVATDALWHLSTTLTGELADPATSSLDLALALHPTPAVCGHPSAPAFDAIAALEPFERGFFAGFVGWCDARGDGEWAVALRCAELRDRELRLYAGAGIVAGSVPASESLETGTKFRTMLSALGLGSALD